MCLLQGERGEALLCKSFYLLRDTFNCGESLVRQHCDPSVIINLAQLKQKVSTDILTTSRSCLQMSELGVEEGCPLVQPPNLDELLSRPIRPQQPVVVAPIAHPMARPMAPATATPPSIAPMCEPDEQRRFSSCVQPLTVSLDLHILCSTTSSGLPTTPSSSHQAAQRDQSRLRGLSSILPMPIRSQM